MDNSKNLLSQLISELDSCSIQSDLEKIKTKYLGRNGIINDLLKKIKDIPKNKKKDYGQQINLLKSSMFRNIEQKQQQLHNVDNQEFIDVTLLGKLYPKGSLHVVTVAIDEICKIYQKIGFIRMSYPEVDWDFFAFRSLNMPKDHPARDDFETSFIDVPENKKYGKMLLTPHTSSGQVREMWRVGLPPIIMINISKCYRPNWDATHTPMFFQFEGLCVDRGINITHLKGALDYFAKEYFGNDCQTRLRPFHFQFTEPSFEVDISCSVCKGKGNCKVCKSGWLELGGCGMVHPNVLKAGEIDSSIYTGWAFGFGIERVIMMKYGIEDIRYYYNGDIRFLEQF